MKHKLFEIVISPLFFGLILYMCRWILISLTGTFGINGGISFGAPVVIFTNYIFIVYFIFYVLYLIFNIKNYFKIKKFKKDEVLNNLAILDTENNIIGSIKRLFKIFILSITIMVMESCLMIFRMGISGGTTDRSLFNLGITNKNNQHPANSCIPYTMIGVDKNNNPIFCI